MSSGARPLEGVKVCMLRTSDYSIDARARKQATALVDAGASVTLIGIGTDLAEDLKHTGYEVELIPRPPLITAPRLGREDVWWPLRVTVNLTYTRILESQVRRRRASLVHPHEDALVAAAVKLRPDVVHAYDVFTLPAAVRVRRMIGCRIVYDVLDLLGDVEYIDETRRQRLKAAEARLIGDVDAVVTVCEPLAEILELRHGVERPTTVFNGPSAVVPAVSHLHTPTKLLFQGGFRTNRNLIALIEAMPALKGRACLALQGFGGIEDELRMRVAELGLEGVVSFVPPVSPLEVVSSASTHDVGVICYKPDSLNLKSAVPNKLMDYLGAGLALAVSDLPGHRSVLEGTGAGVFIDPATPESITRGLEGLLSEPGRIQEMKRAALDLARRFEWPVQAERLVEVYESVLARD